MSMPRYQTTSSPVDDGIYQDLDGVLVCQQVHNLKGMLDYPHRQQLLAVVAAVHHQGSCQPEQTHNTCSGARFNNREAVGLHPSKT